MLAERCSLGGDTPPGTCRPYRAPRVDPNPGAVAPGYFLPPRWGWIQLRRSGRQ